MCGQDDGVGGVILTVKPYLMDLETTNGTFLNGDRIEDQRYYEVWICLLSLPHLIFQPSQNPPERYLG